MPPFNPIQTNFTAGEVSQRMKGRVDIARYANGLQDSKNFLGLGQGPLTRRPGTRFVCPVKTESARGRLTEFEFSSVQAYVIELGNLYARFYKNHGQILNTGQPVTGATNASPIVLTVNAHGYSNGQEVVVKDVLGNTNANGRWIVANQTVNTFELLNSLGNGAYAGGGEVASVVEIAMPYATADLPLLFFTQSADTLYICHRLYPPRKLTRASHTSWSTTEIAFQDGPYLSENTTGTTFTAGAATGNTTLTASATTGVNGGDGFKTTDVGRLVRIRNGTSVGWAEITSWTSTTVVNIAIQSTVSTAALATWRLGAWSDTTGYPSCAVFHEQRLTFANSTAQPQTVWMSVSGEYENFAPSDTSAVVGDDNAVTYTIVSNRVNPIFWLESGPVLLIGSSGQEWQVKAGSINEPISPTNIQVTPQTSYGSRQIRSRRIGNATLFIQRSGRKVREMRYDFQIDGFTAKDLTLLSEHIIREGDYAVDVAYQQEPNSLYWTLRNDGKLAAMVYLPEQEIIGWYDGQIAGSFQGGNAVVESIAAIPVPDATADEIWMTVKRTVNGVTRRYVEYMEAEFSPTSPTDKDSMWFIDSGLSYDGGAATVFSGLDHLEGETVSIVADGSVRPAQVVVNGAITLATAANKVRAGLGYRSWLKTLAAEGGSAFGTAQGKIKRTGKVTVRLLDTLGLKYGVDLDSLHDLPFRKTGDPMDVSPPLFSGDKTFTLDGSYTTEGTYVIVQDDPLPMTILSLMPETVVSK